MLNNSDSGECKGEGGEDSSPRGVAIGRSLRSSRRRGVSSARGEGVREEGVCVPFSSGDYLVHPAHGVGCVRGIEETFVEGGQMEMISIGFVQDRMVVMVPTSAYESCGLRVLSSAETMRNVYQALRTKRRARKTMWGRRAQEYDTKIKSGNPLYLAHVVRELYRNEEQPSPSYSERQYYQLALGRLSREVAVIERIEEKHAVEKLESILSEAA